MLSDRRLVAAAAALLWILGLCAFLPALASSPSRLEMPVACLREAPLTVAVLLAPMLLAPVLLVLTLVPLLSQRAPGRRTDRVVAALVLATLPSALLMLRLLWFLARDGGGCRWVVADAVAAGAALLVLWRAQAAAGWRRHRLRLAAFALASLPLALFLADVLANEVAGPGAWLFAPSVPLLAAVTLPALHAITRR